MWRGKRSIFVMAAAVCLAGTSFAQTQAPAGQAQPAQQLQIISHPTTVSELVNDIILREHQEVATLRHYDPIVETYIQDMRWDPQLGEVPVRDHYYLGVGELNRGVVDRNMLPDPNAGWKNKINPIKDLTSLLGNSYVPAGFLQMIWVDPIYFDLQHYKFTYVRQEFLGAVRTYVFDVTPLPHSGNGRFLGRIWVEDQDFTIVRFNGVFVPQKPAFGWNLHFDSWRTNVGPNLWVPTYIYSAESNLKDFPYGRVQYRSQTRLWGYDLNLGQQETTFSSLQIESSKPIEDQAKESQTVSPVMAEREWQREGEDNVLGRLQRNGIVAPPGPVDKVMDTVVNNLEVTNNLDIEPSVRCRVMLTSTLEAFTIGHTIVLTRGLLDVLPDEPSLAAILAHELASVITGQTLPDKYSFNDTTMMSREETLRRMSFKTSPEEEKIAADKAIELLKNSPYKNQLGQAGLFLKQLASEQKQIPHLISANLGNRVYMADRLMQASPQLQPTKVDQVAALPLGSRIILNPWDDSATLAKAKPVQLLSAREKMPFEVTPFMPYLTRYQATANGATAGDPNQDTAKKNQ